MKTKNSASLVPISIRTFGKISLKTLGLLVLALFGLSTSGQALTVTKASGGTAISADTAANSGAAAWTTLGPITLEELKNGHRTHFRAGTNVTLGLQAPTGFRFNTAVVPDVAFTADRDITAASAAFSSDTLLTITFTVQNGRNRDLLGIGGTTGLQVQPVSTAPLASGNIFRPTGVRGGTAVIKGIVPTTNLNGTGGGATSFGQLIEIAGAPTRLGIQVQPSQNAVVGIPFGRQPVIAVQDLFGNVRTNVNGTVVMAVRDGGSGVLLGTTAAAVANGLATFTNLAADQVSDITITFSAVGLSPVTSSVIQVAPAPEPAVATSLAIQTPPTAANTAGQIFAQQPIIGVLDQYDFPYTNTAGVVITAARLDGSGTLQGTTEIEAIDGVAAFSNLFHTVAGNITIQFTAGSLQPAVSEVLSVVETTADRLAFATEPAAATFGVPFEIQPVVVTRDAFGNFSTVGLAESVILDIALASGSGNLSGTLSEDIGSLEENGVAIFTDLQIDLAGDKQLVATATGFLSATSAVFNVAEQSQTIEFAALADKEYGSDSFTLSATASSGLPVTFVVVSGPATLSNNVVTLTGVGSVTIRASQAGDANYASAPDVDQSFNVSKGDQTITFGALTDKVFGDVPFGITATASSGLAVDFSVVSGPATISNNVITITGVGTVIVRASQAGDENYNAAGDVDQTFAVNKGDQTITFDALADKTFGDVPFTVSANSDSGLAVSFSVLSGPATISNEVVTITGAGSVTIRASQGGDENYNAAADVDQSFAVNKANQTITFEALSNKTFGDASFTILANSDSGLPVSFFVHEGPATVSNNVVTITGAGTVNIRATQAGNENYNAANEVDQTFAVNKANQTITFGALPGKTFGDAPFTISASSDSGLPVSFFVHAGPATISNNVVTITGAGTVNIHATQAGNENYNAANEVDQTFVVSKADQTIDFAALATKTMGDEPFDVNASASSGLTVSFSILSGPATVSGNTVTLTNDGTVTVRASQAGDANYNAAPDVDQSFTVNADPTISVKSDLNGDRNTDIYFQNGTRVIVWQMNGLQFANSVAIAQQQVNTNWTLAGQDDFNRDGKQDILWQHKAGGLSVWYMNGTERIGTASMRKIGVGWKAVAVCDMNNDLSPDVVFQTKDGRVAIRYMQNAKIIAIGLFNQPDAAGWKVRGAGDIDSDTFGDLLVQHTDGQVALWKGQAVSVVARDSQVAVASFPSFGSGIALNGGKAIVWDAVGLGDLNQDKKLDIVLHSPDGRLAVWTMDGAQKTGRASIRNDRRVLTATVAGPR